MPTLREEILLARTALLAGAPVVGIGLGAQILCLAADGGVEPAPLTFEVGHADVTDPNALGGRLPASLPLAIYMRVRPVPPA